MIINKHHHSAFKALGFLFKALGKGDPRPWTKTVLVEERTQGEERYTILVATDGWRLHKVETQTFPIIEPGSYNLLKSSSGYALEKIDVEFVDWRNVIPEYSGDLYRLHCPGDELKALTDAIINVYDRTGLKIRSDFLRDIIPFGPWDFQGAGKGKPVRFQRYDREAYIMPMAGNDDDSK